MNSVIEQMLKEGFENIDYEQAKQDVEPFIRDTNSLFVWGAEFFNKI